MKCSKDFVIRHFLLYNIMQYMEYKETAFEYKINEKKNGKI